MQAIRKFEKIQNNKLIINLPENFTAQEVEVIILAMGPEKIEKSESLSDLLLKGPSFKEDELENIKSIKECYEQWNLP